MLVGLLGVGLFRAVAPLMHNIAASNKFGMPLLNPAIRIAAKDAGRANYPINLICTSNGIDADSPDRANLVFRPWKTISRGNDQAITLESGFLLNRRAQFSPETSQMFACANPFRVASITIIANRGKFPAHIFVTACGSPAVMAGYVAVSNENMGIESTTSTLNTSEVKIIRNLEKIRYLTGLKKRPGIERLRIDVKNSGLSKQFQPNFTHATRNLAEWV